MKDANGGRGRIRIVMLTVLVAVLFLASCISKESRSAHEDGDLPPEEHASSTEEMQQAPDGSIMIDPRKQQMIGVTYGLVERRDVSQLVKTVGVIDYDERRLSDVTLKFHGWVETLYVDETGMAVRAGQPLFSLYSPELVSTQQEYLTAWNHRQRLREAGDSRAIEAADKILNAARERLAYWDIEPAHLRELEEDREVLRSLPIHSPAKGYVIEKNIVEGGHVQPGQLLYRLADLDRVWVLADVYEYELPFVTVGQRATVSLSYLPGIELEATVTYIYPYVQAKERTVKVRLELTNPGHQLKAGMYADVALRAERNDVLVVPATAVIDSGERQIVFVEMTEGRLAPRVVKLGARFEDYVEILSGVDLGERIATSGNFLLDSESQLTAGMRQMTH